VWEGPRAHARPPRGVLAGEVTVTRVTRLHCSNLLGSLHYPSLHAALSTACNLCSEGIKLFEAVCCLSCSGFHMPFLLRPFCHACCSISATRGLVSAESPTRSPTARSARAADASAGSVIRKCFPHMCCCALTPVSSLRLPGGTDVTLNLKRCVSACPAVQVQPMDWSVQGDRPKALWQPLQGWKMPGWTVCAGSQDVPSRSQQVQQV
jgi:hypothetical protein